jgi:hypothetical protein
MTITVLQLWYAGRERAVLIMRRKEVVAERRTDHTNLTLFSGFTQVFITVCFCSVGRTHHSTRRVRGATTV